MDPHSLTNDVLRELTSSERRIAMAVTLDAKRV